MIHDERGEDAKRYDRRMEAKYGDSGLVAVTENATTSMRAKGRASRSASMRRSARRRSAPADVRQRSSKKPFIPAIARNERLFLYGISQYQPLTG